MQDIGRDTGPGGLSVAVEASVVDSVGLVGVRVEEEVLGAVGSG